MSHFGKGSAALQKKTLISNQSMMDNTSMCGKNNT